MISAARLACGHVISHSKLDNGSSRLRSVIDRFIGRIGELSPLTSNCSVDFRSDNLRRARFIEVLVWVITLEVRRCLFDKLRVNELHLVVVLQLIHILVRDLQLPHELFQCLISRMDQLVEYKGMLDYFAVDFAEVVLELANHSLNPCPECADVAAEDFLEN